MCVCAANVYLLPRSDPLGFVGCYNGICDVILSDYFVIRLTLRRAARNMLVRRDLKEKFNTRLNISSRSPSDLSGSRTKKRKGKRIGSLRLRDE